MDGIFLKNRSISKYDFGVFVRNLLEKKLIVKIYQYTICFLKSLNKRNIGIQITSVISEPATYSLIQKLTHSINALVLLLNKIILQK